MLPRLISVSTKQAPDSSFDLREIQTQLERTTTRRLERSKNMSTVKANDSTFDEEVLSAAEPVLVVFRSLDFVLM